MANKCIIPVIDLQDFPNQSSNLIAACEDWGCFRLLNYHEFVQESLLVEMKTVVISLLNLPMEIKRKNIDIIAGGGYVAPSSKNPLYEALGLHDMTSCYGVDEFCAQLDASPVQRETIMRYAEAVHGLIVDIGKKLVKSLGAKSENIGFENWTCRARINKYHFTPQSVGTTGGPMHTDSGFLTILQDDEGVGGLEVMDKSGEFVPVDPWPGTLLVNLGDMATVWSNGRFCNVKHRVQCKEANTRVSIASFLLGPEQILEPLPELVDDDHPRIFVPTTYEDYRKLRFSTKLHAECSIPVIDLHDFPNQSSKLISACEEWGCFRLLNHHEVLPATLMSEMKAVVRSLFDLPVEIKRKNVNVIPGSGYMQAPTATNPFHETLGVYNMISLCDVGNFCSQLDASPHQRETIIRYTKAVHELFVWIGNKLAEGLMVKTENIGIDNWSYLFKINKYHFTPESVGFSGIKTHTDSGFLTILQDDEEVCGLEVMNKSREFVPIDPWPDTLLVNIGDMATVWSNGRFHNVKHRVQCKETKIRVSIASFLLGPKGTVEPLPELVDDEHPRKYVPTSFDDYRKLRFATKLHAGEALEQLLYTPSLDKI